MADEVLNGLLWQIRGLALAASEQDRSDQELLARYAWLEQGGYAGEESEEILSNVDKPISERAPTRDSGLEGYRRREEARAPEVMDEQQETVDDPSRSEEDDDVITSL